MVDIYAYFRSMKNGSDKFVLTYKGDINKIIGVEIPHIDDNIFKVSQPLLIDSIISLLNIDTNDYDMDTNAKSTPIGKPLLRKDLSGTSRK